MTFTDSGMDGTIKCVIRMDQFKEIYIDYTILFLYINTLESNIWNSVVVMTDEVMYSQMRLLHSH